MKAFSVARIGNIPKINMGLYAAGGGGKTTLLKDVCFDPRTAPALWIDAMGNPQLYILNGDIPYCISAESWWDVSEAVEWLGMGQPPNHPFQQTLDKLGVYGPGPFQSVVVDTFTFAQQMLINYILGKKPYKGKGAVPRVSKIDARTHGGDIAGETLRLMRDILMLPVHTFIAYQLWDKTIFEGDAGIITGGHVQQQIALYGQSRDIIPPWHNLMGILNFEKVFRDVKEHGRVSKRAFNVPSVTWRDPGSVGKNQLAPSLGDKLMDPTMKDILDAIEHDWEGFWKD